MTRSTRRRLPRRPNDVVALDRVRAYLDRWAPVTVVLGVQGYGKTTTVAAWLRDQPESVSSVWVSAKAVAHGHDAFTRTLRKEVRQTRLHQRGPEADWDGQALVPTTDNALGLIDRAASGLSSGQRLVLVIDDAHHLRDRAWLLGLIDVVGRHQALHVIVCSRGRPPIRTWRRGGCRS